MICKKCGAEIKNYQNFCVKCGSAVQETPPSKPAGSSPANTSIESVVTDSSSNSKVIITLIIVIGVLFTSLIVIATVLLTREPEPPAKEVVVTEDKIVEKERGTDIVEEVEEDIFARVSTYSPNYEYNSMTDIHSSSPASNQECFDLADFINTYNTKWNNYVNYGDDSIYDHLIPDTKAYQYTEKYSDKAITQSFELIDVKDIRKIDNIYYVWVHEIIDEYGQDYSKRLEYHWVYRVRKESGNYYVENYIADPYYK